ncbi:hypothetical protein ACFL6M_07635, partial [Candidatus Eisenbacteria bacterium]
MAAIHHARRERDRSILLWFLAVTALPLGLYAAWKLSFYGDLRTNTYYARSANLSHFGKGWTYLRLYFSSYFVQAAALLAMIVVAVREGLTGLRNKPRSSSRSGSHPLALILTAVILYLFFVARVGGDFMFARFLIPITPLIFLGGELVIRRINPAWVRYLLAVILVLGTFFTRVSLDHQRGIRSIKSPTGIVEEKHFYPAAIIDEAAAAGSTYARIMGDLPTRIAIYGTQAMLAYYADPPLVIEAHAGLTDAHIAHQGLSERSRVGHEKRATVAYLRERGVDFRFTFGLHRTKSNPVTSIRVGPLRGEILCYRREILDSLRNNPEVEFMDFAQHLDQYIVGIEGRDLRQVEHDYEWFQEYYFQHNKDPERADAIANWIREA